MSKSAEYDEITVSMAHDIDIYFNLKKLYDLFDSS